MEVLSAYLREHAPVVSDVKSPLDPPVAMTPNGATLSRATDPGSGHLPTTRRSQP